MGEEKKKKKKIKRNKLRLLRLWSWSMKITSVSTNCEEKEKKNKITAKEEKIYIYNKTAEIFVKYYARKREKGLSTYLPERVERRESSAVGAPVSVAFPKLAGGEPKNGEQPASPHIPKTNGAQRNPGRDETKITTDDRLPAYPLDPAPLKLANLPIGEYQMKGLQIMNT